jgi:hypothetical protein
MSKFKKDKGSAAPAINTSSLPDIVFMLLFFFMVATTTKEVDPSVNVKAPKILGPGGAGATDMTPFKQRSEVDFIYAGISKNKAKNDGNVYLTLDNISADDEGMFQSSGLYSPEETLLKKWKENKLKKKPVKFNLTMDKVITCLKMDNDVPASTLFQIRNALKKTKAPIIGYVIDNGSN